MNKTQQEIAAQAIVNFLRDKRCPPPKHINFGAPVIGVICGSFPDVATYHAFILHEDYVFDKQRMTFLLAYLEQTRGKEYIKGTVLDFTNPLPLA